MKDKLRELAAEWLRKGEFSKNSGAPRCGGQMIEDAAELLAILDAEGDGGAVLFAYGSEDGRVIPKATRDVALRDGGASKSATDIYTIPLYTRPARSGVVSDEDVEAACIASLIQYDDGTTEWGGYTDKEKGYAMNRMRRALEHFAKGERHER